MYSVSYTHLDVYKRQGLDFSPIRGPEGNIEFLMDLRRDGGESLEPEVAQTVVRAAYDKFIKSSPGDL